MLGLDPQAPQWFSPWFWDCGMTEALLNPPTQPPPPPQPLWKQPQGHEG